MSEKKIETFLDTVYSAAETKSKKMIREIDRAGEASLREYRAELRRSADADRRRERARAVKIGAEAAAHYESMIRQTLLNRRREITDEVFSEVRRNIEKYRTTEDYKNSLVRDASKLGELLAGADGAYLLMSADDAEHFGDVETASGFTVKSTPKIKLGGIIGVCADAEYDCTLDGALDAAKADFARESGLSVV